MLLLERQVQAPTAEVFDLDVFEGLFRFQLSAKITVTTIDSVFHYAPWLYLEMIVAGGFLKASSAGGAPHETPMVWFSSNQQWEPTATKMSRPGVKATIGSAAFKNQLANVGCVRFRFPRDDARLLQWREACKAAGISSTTRKLLEASGRRVGAEPEAWKAVAANVPLADLQLEIFGGNGWHPANPTDMVLAWNTHMANRKART